VKTGDLAAEMRAATAAMTQADVGKLTAFGVWPANIELWQLVA
jgi:hypothetical protein